MEKILLDTDIGSDVDDALAQLFADKLDGLEIAALTTVYGKTDIRAKIAKKIFDYAGSKVPVYVGESNPIRSGMNEIWHTRREGEGILTREDRKASLFEMDIRENAVGFLIDEIMKHKGEYNLVTIGALTNIARALQEQPEIAKHIKHHYIMGGAIAYPRQLDFDHFPTPYTEHNFNCDIEAAQIVLASETPKTLVPLDITCKTLIRRESFQALKTKGPLEQAVGRLVDVWFDYRDDVFRKRVKSTCMHDPLTVALITHPHLVKTKRLSIYVNTNGQTLINERKGNPMDVGVEVDIREFENLFLKTIYK